LRFLCVPSCFLVFYLAAQPARDSPRPGCPQDLAPPPPPPPGRGPLTLALCSLRRRARVCQRPPRGTPGEVRRDPLRAPPLTWLVRLPWAQRTAGVTLTYTGKEKSLSAECLARSETDARRRRARARAGPPRAVRSRIARSWRASTHKYHTAPGRETPAASLCLCSRLRPLDRARLVEHLPHLRAATSEEVRGGSWTERQAVRGGGAHRACPSDQPRCVPSSSLPRKSLKVGIAEMPSCFATSAASSTFTWARTGVSCGQRSERRCVASRLCKGDVGVLLAHPRKDRRGRLAGRAPRRIAVHLSERGARLLGRETSRAPPHRPGAGARSRA